MLRFTVKVSVKVKVKVKVWFRIGIRVMTFVYDTCVFVSLRLCNSVYANKNFFYVFLRFSTFF